MTKDRRADPETCGHYQSIHARIECMKRILRNPSNNSTDGMGITALKSQNGLAKLSIKDLGITPMSLNTFKSKANEIFPGGFAVIDSLRIEALNLLKTPPVIATRTDSKKNLLLIIQSQKNELSQLRDDMALINSCLVESMRIAQEFAEKSNDPKDFVLYKKRRKELLVMLSTGHRLNEKDINF